MSTTTTNTTNNTTNSITTNEGENPLPPSSSSAGHSSDDGSREDVVDAARRQLEHYLSIENLQRDVYLVSQMDAEQYVPLSLLAGFRMLRQITEDMQVVTEAARQSTRLSLDRTATRVRPLALQEHASTTRQTVIIRDIPRDTDRKLVETLFPETMTPHSLKAEVGNTWWAVFETQEQAVTALEHLRTQEFQDAPVSAHIKSETLLKSDNKPLSVGAAEFTPMSSSAARHAWKYDPNYTHHHHHHHHQRTKGGQRAGSMRGNFQQGTGKRNARRHLRLNEEGVASAAAAAAESSLSQRRALKSGKRNHAAQSTSTAAAAAAAAITTEADMLASSPSLGTEKSTDNNSTASSKGNGNGSPRPSSHIRQQGPPKLSASSFPPLPPISASNTSGYAGHFIKYDKQVIIDVHRATFENFQGNLPQGMSLDRVGVVPEPYTQLELTKPPLEDNTVVSPIGPMMREDVENMFVAATANIVASSKVAQSISSSNSPNNDTIATAVPSGKSFAEVAVHAKDIQPPRKGSISLNKRTKSRAGSRAIDAMKPSAELLAKARSKLELLAERDDNTQSHSQQQQDKGTSKKKPLGQQPATEEEDGDGMNVVVRRKRYQGRYSKEAAANNAKTHKERASKPSSGSKQKQKQNGHEGTNDGVRTTTEKKKPLAVSLDEKSYASIASKIKAETVNHHHQGQGQEEERH